MPDLEDTFGEDFAEHVEERVQERRAERERISDRTRQAIADKAINEEAFKDGDPMFEYTSEEGVTHNVLLMQLAQPREGTVWSQARQLDSGAISVPLDYLGDWVWSIFNEDEMAKKMEPEEWYIVVGNLSQWEPEDGPAQDQLSPVRGVIDLDEAKELANATLEEEGFGEEDKEPREPQEPEEESSEEESEDEEDSPSEGGIFSGGDEDEDEEEDEEEESTPIDVTYGEVANVVEELADEEEEVWEVHEDHPELSTFTMVICDKLGLDADDGEVLQAVAEMALDRVDEGPRDNDISDDDDSLF